MTVSSLTTGSPQTDRPYDPIDLSSRAFWSTTAGDRERSFAELRSARPVSWHPPVEDSLMPDPSDRGYWAVTRHADVVEVSRNSEVFLSGRGVLFENIPPELLEASQSFLAMDPPRHTVIRKVVHAAFTPRQVGRIEDSIKANATDIVGELRSAGSGADFVDLCAKELPVRTLADMVGIPDSERRQVAAAADALVSWGDPVSLDGRNPLEVLVANQMYLHQVALELAAHRREKPGDDLFSALVHAEVEGARLTDPEIAAFFVLLAVAGNDTTRQTMSHGIKALTDFGAERAWLTAAFDDRIGGAVEEFVRWATPVMTFRRTAASDYQLGDRQIAAGEKVVMFYSSANRDPVVFDRPERFDLSRSPNPHVAFGGGGRHFCLGTHVARAQLRAIFAELLHQLPGILAGEPSYVAGNFIHAIRRMPCHW